MKLLALVLVLGACGREQADAGHPVTAGHERADCRPDKTCEPGLLCLSNLCVRPPPADCQAVAEQLASMDLGNYAEPETRAPVIANYKAACDKAYVSKEEGACLDQAHDKWAASQCAPRMFPELASSGTGDCAKVSDKIRAVMSKQMQTVTDPSTRKMLDGAIAAISQSCTDDKWPVALKKCVLASPDDGHDAMQQCNQQMPPGLQQKLQERMMKLMQPTPTTP